ncbi:Putative membrane protein%2C MmpL family [Mycobacteroides abscessus]|uniref:MMPL/RND family transporter n=1 Tax=Mycobacteroides abscessus TaxID=36809 RepID=UPI000318F2BB|nr:MMPL family transporter [Mycobacteroides abscessus]AMU29874.1 hypothetical protein A3N97_04145 [Mycobacteroides abscessus]MDM2495084.1 MMPL family transporter [Mycobacteroides abscessus]MDM2513960.1 MMPL family transporter [Mycobacteroides abscessus]MDM2524345.1 MMPL family transporter [Mycobacteroides abscessus]MDM2528748.1 MMPL family transporter [Mycobacteroides abscessus]
MAENTGGIYGLIAQIVRRAPVFVIGLWIGLAAVLALTAPSLQKAIEDHPVDLLPKDAPVMETTRQMVESFQESGAQNILLIVLTNENGLTPADEQTYRILAARMREDTRDVSMVQDFITKPPLREMMSSTDGKAWYLPVGLQGELATPESGKAYVGALKIIKDTTQGTSLKAFTTGPTATVGDLTVVGERDLHKVEITTAALVLLILLIVYRNPVTMMLPLIVVGVSLGIAQAAVGGLAQMGLSISNQTLTFMTAMMMGAGVDYAVFLISRYHEYIKQGLASDDAVAAALESIGKVVAASAATVAVTFLGMGFTKLGILSTVGPALSVSILIAFVASVTFLPAVLVLVGRRGWITPRRAYANKIWHRSGINIVKRPGAHLAVSLVVLVILATCGAMVKFGYDDRKNLPPWADSNQGYAAIEKHFPVNSTLPQYLYIKSPHDLRTPRGLADLEQMAARVSQVPGVDKVRGITRPTGEPLEEAKLSYQAGEVGGKLGDASNLIDARTRDLDKLAAGGHTLADKLGQVRDSVKNSLGTARALVEVLAQLRGSGRTGTLADLDSVDKLVTSMHSLGDAIEANAQGASEVYGWIEPVARVLVGNPACDMDPGCRSSRDEMNKFLETRQDGTRDKIVELGRELKSVDNDKQISSTIARLRTALNSIDTNLRRLGLSDSYGIQKRFTEVLTGVNSLADGSAQLAEGVQMLVDQTKQMGGQLGDASTLLVAAKRDAAPGSMSGFYIPQQVLTQDSFKTAAAAFVSADGHAVRYLVQSNLNPFSPEAMDQVRAIQEAARSAQPNTTLSDASISMAGLSAMYNDIRNYYNHDLRFIIVLTVIVVLLILVALLRAIVAPLYLIGSVIISYASAVGIGVIAFQFIGGQPLSWSVPGMAFIVLVAVGADYNLLFISRIRDESPDGIRSGVIKTVKSTGGVITSAGVIFAASMFGLLIGNLQSMVEAGFIIGMGLLLDTFLVRTITIPALVVLCGQANWWPSASVESWFRQRFSRSKPDAREGDCAVSDDPEAASGESSPEEPPISASREVELAGRR